MPLDGMRRMFRDSGAVFFLSLLKANYPASPGQWLATGPGRLMDLDDNLTLYTPGFDVSHGLIGGRKREDSIDHRPYGPCID